MPRPRKTTIFCAAIDCKWYSDTYNRCICPNVSLSNGIVQTKYQGAMPFWTCKQYEMSEHSKEQKAVLDSIISHKRKERP